MGAWDWMTLTQKRVGSENTGIYMTVVVILVVIILAVLMYAAVNLIPRI